MHRSLYLAVTLLVGAALALSVGFGPPSPAAAQAAMVATGVSPNYGPSSGGTQVTITGTGFGSDTGFALLVGQTNAYAYTDVTCTSSTTCTARTPAAPIVQRGEAQQAQTVASLQTAPPASNPFTVYGPTSLEALLPKDDTIEDDFVPVRFHSHITELGVFELWCQSTKSSNRWKLEFSVRKDADT